MASGASDRGDRAFLEDAWSVRMRGETTLAIVCDGMGPGGASGRPAADLAVAAVVDAFEANRDVNAALLRANLEMLARAHAGRRREPGADPFWYGRGTTAEMAVFEPNRVHLAHVGDGAIYRLRGEHLALLTEAHTLGNEWRRHRPDLTDEEAAGIAEGVLVRALGMKPELLIDTATLDTQVGDIWLVCSEELTAVLDDTAIATHLASGGSEAALAARLVAGALAAPRPKGTYRENVTVVVHAI